MGVADALNALEGRELVSAILETCTGLTALTEQIYPVNEMSDGEINETIEGYTALYFVMNGFLDKAGSRVPLSKALEDLRNGNRRYNELVTKYTETLDEQTRVKKMIADKEAEIQRVYSDSNGQLARYEALTKQYDEVKKLSADYSDDKLVTLEKECAALKEETDVLKERAETVNETTAQCIASVSDSLKKLLPVLTSAEAEARSTAEEADRFGVMIKTVLDTKKNYEGWFGVLKTPLQQFEEDVGKAEAEKLKGVLDEKGLKSVNESFKVIGDELNKLTSLVSACAKASNIDLKNTVKKAGK